MSGGRGGAGVALPVVLLIALIGGTIAYQTYIAPYFTNHPFTVPRIALPTVGQVVTFVTDAAGHASTDLTHTFNVTLSTPNLEAVAIIHTNNTSLATEGFQADLQLPGIQFTIAQSNVMPGPDRTVFTWDISILHFVPGPMQLNADVIISLVSCGNCSNTTFKVPVELAITVNE